MLVESQTLLFFLEARSGRWKMEHTYPCLELARNKTTGV